MSSNSFYVNNLSLIESARDLLRIRHHFGSWDDIFRENALVLKCLIELTDCDKEDCLEALQTAHRMEAQLNAQKD